MSIMDESRSSTNTIWSSEIPTISGGLNTSSSESFADLKKLTKKSKKTTKKKRKRLASGNVKIVDLQKIRKTRKTKIVNFSADEKESPDKYMSTSGDSGSTTTEKGTTGYNGRSGSLTTVESITISEISLGTSEHEDKKVTFDKQNEKEDEASEEEFEKTYIKAFLCCFCF